MHVNNGKPIHVGHYTILHTIHTYTHANEIQTYQLRNYLPSPPAILCTIKKLYRETRDPRNCTKGSLVADEWSSGGGKQSLLVNRKGFCV